jgi:hypothetical protein
MGPTMTKIFLHLSNAWILGVLAWPIDHSAYGTTTLLLCVSQTALLSRYKWCLFYINKSMWMLEEKRIIGCILYMWWIGHLQVNQSETGRKVILVIIRRLCKCLLFDNKELLLAHRLQDSGRRMWLQIVTFVSGEWLFFFCSQHLFTTLPLYV